QPHFQHSPSEPNRLHRNVHNIQRYHAIVSQFLLALHRYAHLLMPLESKFGAPLKEQRSDSADSILIVEPTLGLDVSHPSVNAKPGATRYIENFIIRDGVLD